MQRLSNIQALSCYRRIESGKKYCFALMLYVPSAVNDGASTCQKPANTGTRTAYALIFLLARQRQRHTTFVFLYLNIGRQRYQSTHLPKSYASLGDPSHLSVSSVGQNMSHCFKMSKTAIQIIPGAASRKCGECQAAWELSYSFCLQVAVQFPFGRMCGRYEWLNGN